MAGPIVTPVAGSATPYSKVYDIVGGADPGILLWTTIDSQLVAGPLKAELARLAATPTGLPSLNLTGTNGRVRIYFPVGINLLEGVPPGGDIDIHWVATGLSIQIPATGPEVNSSMLIEIRFRHSSKR